jgi:hypothetical protein
MRTAAVILSSDNPCAVRAAEAASVKWSRGSIIVTCLSLNFSVSEGRNDFFTEKWNGRGRGNRGVLFNNNVKIYDYPIHTGALLCYNS